MWRRCAGVGEWLKPADCKSAAFGLRRFESCPLHHWEYHRPDSSVVERVLGKNEVPSSILGLGSSHLADEWVFLVINLAIIA